MEYQKLSSLCCRVLQTGMIIIVLFCFFLLDYDKTSYKGCSSYLYKPSTEGTFELDHTPLEVILAIVSPTTEVFYDIL